MNNIDLLGRMPPHDPDIERAVLGALMLDGEALTSISGFVNVETFYKHEHQVIFKAIKSLNDKGEVIDLLTVVNQLKTQNQLDFIGGALYIAQLTRDINSADRIDTHAKLLAEKAFKRQMIIKATENINLAYSDEDVEFLSNKWRADGDHLDDVFINAGEGTEMKNLLFDTLKEIEADCARVNTGKMPGITTGFKTLDELTGGWKPGNMIVLAARPGVGKTSVALHFATHATKAGYWVNFFSLEIRSADLTRILIASESDIYRSNIRDGYINETDWGKINKAVATLENLPFIFCDINGLNISSLLSNIKRNRKRGKCDLVIVDYMQLVNPATKKAVREQEVSEISRALKSISLSENIPVIALSQLNRIEDTKEPTLTNLRESGSIEQDADLIMFLHIPDPLNNPDNITMSIKKHRGGRLDQTGIMTNRDRTRFFETTDNTF